MIKELKKHVTQFSSDEIDFVNWRVNKRRRMITLDNLHISSHARDSIKKRKRFNITDKMLINTIKHSNIIEYKLIINKFGKISDERVVLRGKKNHHGSNLIVSYSIKTNSLITLWINSTHDNHQDTLDYMKYDADLKILEVFKC